MRPKGPFGRGKAAGGALSAGLGGGGFQQIPCDTLVLKHSCSAHPREKCEHYESCVTLEAGVSVLVLWQAVLLFCFLHVFVFCG